jgi:hypothetical protein
MVCVHVCVCALHMCMDIRVYVDTYMLVAKVEIQAYIQLHTYTSLAREHRKTAVHVPELVISIGNARLKFCKSVPFRESQYAGTRCFHIHASQERDLPACIYVIIEPSLYTHACAEIDIYICRHRTMCSMH